MPRTPRRALATVVAVLVISGPVAAQAAPAPTAPEQAGVHVAALTAPTALTAAATTDRISGADRYATSASISQEAFPGSDGPSTVYLASGAAFPDAIAAGPAAAATGSGLLITEPGRLTPVIATELRRLDPDRIVLVGGTGALRSAVASAASAIAPVSRLAGSDRYATADALVRAVFEPGGAPHVYLATGAGFPDALAAGPAAATLDAPVVLVRGTQSSLPSATRSLLRDLGVESVTIVGGTSVVSTGIERSLNALLGSANVTRAAGADRYATAVALNTAAFGSASGGLFVATGTGFPDALSVTVLAAQRGEPLYLSLPYCAPSAVRGTLRSSSVDSVTLVGGPAAIATSVASGNDCESITRASSPWVLVNKRNSISTNFVPSGLRVPDVSRTGSYSLRSSAASALESMIAAARSEGAGRIGLSSGYRSASSQAAIYNRTLSQSGRAYADSLVARPGHSEHQLGLAVDLYPIGASGCSNYTCIGSTPQGRWLAANSWRFGFILRYESGMTSVTGYSPEPWHFRWVGTSLAADYEASGRRSLEQFLGQPAAPSY